MDTLNKHAFALNRSWRDILSLWGSLSKIELEKNEAAGKIEIINSGIDQDNKIVSLLKGTMGKITEELKTAEAAYGDIRGAMKETGELVRKLESIDTIQTELAGLKRVNTSLRLKVTPLSVKTWKLQEELFNIKKEREQVRAEHLEVTKKCREFVSLRTKILPLGKILELREGVKTESRRLEENLKELEFLKEKLSSLAPMRDDMKEELKTTLERLSTVQERVSSMKEKISKISPRVMPEEDEKRMATEVSGLKAKRDALNNEKKALSPKVASLAEEEENAATILDSYRAKNKKDSAKLVALKKDLKELDIDKNSIDKLREKALLKSNELEARSMESAAVKKEYAEVAEANQKYKAVIEEVDKGTKKLKKMMKGK